MVSGDTDAGRSDGKANIHVGSVISITTIDPEHDGQRGVGCLFRYVDVGVQAVLRTIVNLLLKVKLRADL